MNAVAPGMIATDFSAPLNSVMTLPKDATGTADQIGSVVAMMCSMDGSFINGETFKVHGGYSRLHKL